MQIGLTVLPAPDPEWGSKRLGGWIADMAYGASSLVASTMPMHERDEEDTREVRSALLWLVHDLGELAFAAGRLVAGRKTEIRRECIPAETKDRLSVMARILGVAVVDDSEQIDMVRRGIAMRLEDELAEWAEARGASSAEARA